MSLIYTNELHMFAAIDECFQRRYYSAEKNIFILQKIHPYHHFQAKKKVFIKFLINNYFLYLHCTYRLFFLYNKINFFFVSAHY